MTVMSDVDTDTDSAPTRSPRAQRLDRRFEFWEAVILAIATVLTAWSAFQSTKWSGHQANSYSEAAAKRTEASIAATEAGALTVIDVQVYLQWLAAINAEELAAGSGGLEDDGEYTPDPTTLSGFLFERFRDEFRPALDAWLDQDPLENPDAADTPFALPEYTLEPAERSEDLSRTADQSSATARSANQRSDNYVLVTVLFASVLFFAGMSSKMDTLRARVLLISLALTVMGTGVVFLIIFPKLV